MEERRSYQRYPVSLEVLLKENPGAVDAVEATVVDVSYGGLGIVSGRGIPPGTHLFVEWPDPPFYFAGDAVVQVVVVSGEPEEGEDGKYRLRVKFRDSDSELSQSLLNWVQMQVNRQKLMQRGRAFSGQKKRIRF